MDKQFLIMLAAAGALVLALGGTCYYFGYRAGADSVPPCADTMPIPDDSAQM